MLLGIAILVMIGAGTPAALRPALRASSIDPAETLRSE
jgi:ABC-type lipoprotein release transport system permease subunit